MTRSIRDATRDDYPSFVRLFDELGVPEPAPAVGEYAEKLAPNAFFVQDDEVIVGYGVLRVLAGCAHFVHIVTAPESRKRGVGRAVMDELARRARAAGCASAMLNVKRDNATAIRLYERCGMRITAETTAMLIAWRSVADLPGTIGDAFAVQREDEAEVLAAFSLPASEMDVMRARADRILVGVRVGGAVVGLASFDPTFPGAGTFRVTRTEHARALLEAIAPHALPEHDFVRLTVDPVPSLVAQLRKAGATVTLELFRMERTL